jgi:hypothetical protein
MSCNGQIFTFIIITTAAITAINFIQSLTKALEIIYYYYRVYFSFLFIYFSVYSFINVCEIVGTKINLKVNAK